MERERPKEEEKEAKVVPKEKDQELEVMKKELERLRELKREKEIKKLQEKSVQETTEAIPKERYLPEEGDAEMGSDIDVDARFEKINDFLTSNLGKIDEQTYEQHSKEIEAELQLLEEEIIGEKGLIEKELSAYEKLLESYPWLEEKRYEFMYSIPPKKEKLNDYESWKKEWSKVFFDYARYAILHIIYVKQVAGEIPFSKFQDRNKAINKIFKELIKQGLAKYLTKKKERLRIYWKTLDSWAEEIYNWAYDQGKLDPIMVFEIRDAKLEFSNLPRDDLEEIFKILAKNRKGKVIKSDEGQLAFRIILE
jgi:hypothetical protein